MGPVTDDDPGLRTMSAETADRFRETVARFFQEYVLAFVMVSSYFGSGSIFIASSAGVRYGYALIWASSARPYWGSWPRT
jgi:hypothetical protein